MNINKKELLGAFLPCRRGSQRILGKNTKPFAKNGESLLEIKLMQLSNAPSIDIIVVSTNDRLVKSIVEEFKSNSKKEIQIIDRDEDLSSNIAKTDDLVKHASELLNTKFILWTHVTSPFMNEDLYEHCISIFKENFYSKKNNSLMTVNKLQKHIWDNKGPLNYDKDIIKWPNTQTLPERWLINSAAFIATKEIYVKDNDRVCKNPYYYEMNDFLSLDIDNIDDWKFAQMCWEVNKKNHSY